MAGVTMFFDLDTMRAMAYLLPWWLTEPDRGGGMDPGVGWSTGVTVARLPVSAREETLWRPSPSQATVERFGRYPSVFVAAGARGQRYPVAVEPFVLPDVDDEGPPPSQSEASLLILDALSAGTGRVPRRVRVLTGYLLALLSDGADASFRVWTAASPDGQPLADEVHLLVRGTRDLVRFACAPPAAAAPVGDVLPDPRDILLGRREPGTSPTPEAHRQALFDTRLTCLSKLLAGLLMVSNSGDHIMVEATTRPHGLIFPKDDLDTADAVFHEWLSGEGSAVWTDTVTKRFGDPAAQAAQMAQLTPNELGDVLAALEDEFVETETGGEPRVDRDSVLSTWLWRDLVGTACDRDADGALLLRYAVGLPRRWDEPADVGYGLLLLVGPERVGTILVHWPF